MLHQPERRQADEHVQDRRVPAAVSQTNGAVPAAYDTAAHHRQSESKDRELAGNTVLFNKRRNL